MTKLNDVLMSFDSLHKCNGKSYMLIFLMDDDNKIIDVCEYNIHYDKVVKAYSFYDVVTMYEPQMESYGIQYRVAIKEPKK